MRLLLLISVATAMMGVPGFAATQERTEKVVVHGSPLRYDIYVPILFAGNGIKPQTASRRVHTVDVALTLATVIGTRPLSGAAGEVLLEALGQ